MKLKKKNKNKTKKKGIRELIKIKPFQFEQGKIIKGK